MTTLVNTRRDFFPASFLEQCFTVFILLYSTGAFVNLFIGSDQLLDPAVGVPELRYLWAVIYVITFALWRRHCRNSLGLLLREWPVILLVGLALVSVAWSDAPALTFRRGIALVGTCLIALYIAARYRLREQLRLLVWMCAISVVFSFFFGWFHWGAAVDGLEGAWIGIYTQRNSLGSMMVLSALIFLLWGKFEPLSRWKARALAAAAAVLLILSGSMTALVAFLFVLILFPVIRALTRSSRRVAGFLLLASTVAVGLGYWVASHFETVTQAMGRDPGLSGRISLWAASALMAAQRPWLGYGYNAFWLGLAGPSAGVWRVIGWRAPASHNGLLEIWLDLGAVGVAIAMLGFAGYFVKAFRLLRETPVWENAWPLMFLGIIFVLNLTENIFFGANNIYWLLYMVMALDLSLLEKRREKKIATAPDGGRSFRRATRLPASEAT